MFIPYGTDTPIYHWPISTGILIGINVLVFAVQTNLPDGGLALALAHGDGLHPLQWISSMFAHGGIMHLLLNMVFLWVFGIIVEGKIGPFFFPLVYCAIGFIQNVFEQVVFLAAEQGFSLGASSAIYGIMMVSVLWAPRDNILSVFTFYFRVYFFGIPIAVFGVFYFLWDFGFAIADGFQMGTPLLHVLGALFGTAVGFAILVLGWVDCEGGDMLNLIREARGLKPKQRKSRKQISKETEQREREKLDRTRKRDVLIKSVDAHMSAGNIQAAIKTHLSLRKLDSSAVMSKEHLIKIISKFRKDEKWDQVVRHSTSYLQSHDAASSGQTTTADPIAIKVRIQLAKIYLLHSESPRKALAIIQPIAAPNLSEAEQRTLRSITLKAKKMIAEGSLELGD